MGCNSERRGEAYRYGGTSGQLMDAVREVGKELVAGKPAKLAVGDMVV